ncbi:hypothetical protein G3N55_09650 [Dissulfurirhabdus thermomarina]|uniref:Uncharacterized protein n=1 Tax=Dissulfurirhabdus thermomarina TaxID=1765737 RepID=A0A6N9TSP5_DISTH|nr:hypothetical protein [Dissulfurirhabdus thermomarina]NDY43103.1 hypothetical protein [Dissulfurirhabdus thermomarina]NMX24455.1 hypothetical protein [Dissulfurirhabdus thermomarina]
MDDKTVHEITPLPASTTIRPNPRHKEPRRQRREPKDEKKRRPPEGDRVTIQGTPEPPGEPEGEKPAPPAHRKGKIDIRI